MSKQSEVRSIPEPSTRPQTHRHTFYYTPAYYDMRMDQTNNTDAQTKNEWTSIRVRRSTHDAFVEKYERDTAKNHNQLALKMIEGYTAELDR